MLSLLLYIVVMLLIFGVIFYVIDLFPGIPANIRMIAKLIIGLILLIVVINMVLGLPGVGGHAFLR